MSFHTDFSKIDLTKYYFDEVAADSAVKYIEKYCYHVKGSLSGTPFILEDWQKEQVVRPLFGWKHKEPTIVKDANGRVVASINKRKYRKVYIEIPKKNGKSTLLSAFGQIALDIDPEQGSEIVGLAWGRKQASIIFDMVEKSVRKNPRLQDKIQYYRSNKVLLGSDKRYSLWTKEAGGEDGQFPQWVFIDELHEHKNGDIVSVAEKSMMGRIQPVSMTITTAGANLDGIGYERRKYCEKVSTGVIVDESQLVCIYCADLDDDIYDEKTWYKANPQLGRSISLEDFKEEVKAARTSTMNENAFKRYFLNIWTNSADSWLNDEVWNKNNYPLDKSLLEGLPCYAGLDLSNSSDITAFSLVFKVDERYTCLNWYWLPQDKGAHSADEENRLYPDWLKQGLIRECPGDRVDYKQVRDDIFEICETYEVKGIAVDPYSASLLASDLQEDGLPIIFFKQGWSTMAPPTKQFEEFIHNGEYNHLGDPVLRWMAGNAVAVKDRNDNIFLTKQHAKRRLKIDGLITNIMALALSIENKNETTYLSGGAISFI